MLWEVCGEMCVRGGVLCEEWSAVGGVECLWEVCGEMCVRGGVLCEEWSATYV